MCENFCFTATKKFPIRQICSFFGAYRSIWLDVRRQEAAAYREPRILWVALEPVNCCWVKSVMAPSSRRLCALSLIGVWLMGSEDASALDFPTPLHSTVVRGTIPQIEKLLHDGARLDAKDRSGNTPLHIAVDIGRNTIAELLIDYGANVNPTSATGGSRRC